VAEGGGLLNRYTLQRRIEGSNPSVSASSESLLRSAAWKFHACALPGHRVGAALRSIGWPATAGRGFGADLTQVATARISINPLKNPNYTVYLATACFLRNTRPKSVLRPVGRPFLYCLEGTIH
jgi:hypothetical protein